MKRYLMAAMLVTIMCASAYAAGTLPPEFSVDQDAPQYSEGRTARDEITEFLSGKGYHEGLNTRNNGGDFFIAIGTGTIQAGRNTPAYMSSRANAFEKAMLAAKKHMVEYIGVEIQKRVLSDYTEGEDPALKPNKADTANSEPDLYDKTNALISAKLDRMLEAEGVELGRPVPPNIVQKVATSEVFEKFTRTAANARATGMQVMKVFEVSPDGKQGQLGVITVYSDKLHQMANALFSANPSPIAQGTPKRPVVEQIPSDRMVLLSSFGVQQKTDQNGNLVLIAYGQSAPRTDNPRSLDAAYDKAGMEAMGALRSFAGEIAAVSSDLHEYESLQEFEDGMQQYESESYYKQKIETHADALKISGIAKIKQWEAVHPLTSRKVTGVVIAWSPGSAAKATSIGAKMAAQPDKNNAAPSPHPQSRNEAVPAGFKHSGSYSGAGASADEDSF